MLYTEVRIYTSSLELLAFGVPVCSHLLQARSNVLTGKYPCTVEEAITLGGLSTFVMEYTSSGLKTLWPLSVHITLWNEDTSLIGHISGPNSCTCANDCYPLQISYGDHTPMVHNSGFLQEHLDEVLLVTMTKEGTTGMTSTSWTFQNLTTICSVWWGTLYMYTRSIIHVQKVTW